MNLRSRLLILGAIALILQIFAFFAFFYYFLAPKVTNLEKSLVEKNLHRGLEIIQRELLHLTHTTQLIAQDPLMAQLISNPSLQLTPNETLQHKMLRQEINLIYVLNNDHKVIWDSVLDLTTELAYPKQDFLTSLWEKRPVFLDHTTPLSVYAGIFSSTLGPLFVVSAPITSVTESKVIGTLIVGRLITQDVLHLIQSMSYTDVRLWPLGGQKLSAHQRAIIQQLISGLSDFTVEKSGDLLRGYMYLRDINQQPNLLMSATQSRELTQTIEYGITEMIGIFIVMQIIFLIIFYLLIHFTFLKPARTIIEQVNNVRKNWRPFRSEAKPWNEMGVLEHAISNLVIRYQDKLAHDTTLAYREGCYQTRQNLFNEIEDTLKLFVDNIEITENKLSNLPTNDLEWIIAESKTGQYSAHRFAEYTDKLQAINDKLRFYQKETRHRLYDLYAKTLRNTAALRAQSRSLDTIREFTPIRVDTNKEKSGTDGY